MIPTLPGVSAHSESPFLLLSPAQILEVGIGKEDRRTNRNVTMTTHARKGLPDIAKLFRERQSLELLARVEGRAKCLKLVGCLCGGADLSRTASVAHMEQGGDC